MDYSAPIDGITLAAYCQEMPKSAKTPLTVVPRNAPPALTAWKDRDRQLKSEAQRWAREVLTAYFRTVEAYTPRTAAEIMHDLDSRHDMPSAYADLVGREDYDTRYNIVRNMLEQLARQKQAVISEALNTRNQPSSAYARPRDVADQWAVIVNATDADAQRTAISAIREWMALNGASLEHVNAIMLTKRTGGGERNESEETAGAEVRVRRRNSGAQPNPKRGTARSRKPRNTVGGD